MPRHLPIRTFPLSTDPRRLRTPPPFPLSAQFLRRLRAAYCPPQAITTATTLQRQCEAVPLSCLCALALARSPSMPVLRTLELDIVHHVYLMVQFAKTPCHEVAVMSICVHDLSDSLSTHWKRQMKEGARKECEQRGCLRLEDHKQLVQRPVYIRPRCPVSHHRHSGYVFVSKPILTRYFRSFRAQVTHSRNTPEYRLLSHATVSCAPL